YCLPTQTPRFSAGMPAQAALPPFILARRHAMTAARSAHWLTICILVASSIALSQRAGAQDHPIAPVGTTVPYLLDSGTLANPADSEQVGFSQSIISPDSTSLRLHFSEAALAPC